MTRRPRSDGRAERDEAIERVDQHAPDDWKSEARVVVSVLAYERPSFTTDDVWDRMTNRPPEPRALGAVMVWARNKGFITATSEMRESERPEAHRNPKRVWQSNCYEFTAGSARDVPKPQHKAPPEKELRRHEPKSRRRRASSTGTAQPVVTKPARPKKTAEERRAEMRQREAEIRAQAR